MNVKYENEYQYMPFIVKELEDHPGGGAVALGDLDKSVSDCVPPGFFLGRDEKGLFHVLVAVVLVAAAVDTDKSFKVKKGSQFKVGQFASCGDVDEAKASKVTAIDRTNAEYDLVTLDAVLGVALTEGMYLHQVEAADTEGGKSELPHVPFGIAKREIDITASHASVGILVRGTVNVANMAFGAPKIYRKALEPLVRFD